jgi:hypothetical protein
MTAMVHNLAAVELHHHRIQPYGGAKQDSLEECTSKCRVAYNLYIGSIMNREVCFSQSINEDEQDLYSHSIREDIEVGSEIELCNQSNDEWRST